MRPAAPSEDKPSAEQRAEQTVGLLQAGLAPVVVIGRVLEVVAALQAVGVYLGRDDPQCARHSALVVLARLAADATPAVPISIRPTSATVAAMVRTRMTTP